MILAIYITEAIDTTISLLRLWLLSSHSYYKDHSREGFDKMNRGALAAMIDRKLLLSLILSRSVDMSPTVDFGSEGGK